MAAMESSSMDLVGASGDVGHVDADPIFQEEKEELQHELENLKADQIYADFVEKVLSPKAAGYPEEDEAKDPIFKPEKIEIEDANDDASSSSSDDESDDEHHEEDDENLGGAIQDVDVPVEMTKEAKKRFPPFWRVNQQLKKLDDDMAEADAEDAEFQDEQQDDSSSSSSESEDYSSAKEDHEEGDANTSAMDAESELVELIQDIKIAAEEIQVPREEPLDDEVEVQMPGLARAIESFDADGYKADEDPNYEPSDESSSDAELDTDGDDDSGSSSEAENKMEE